MPLFEKLGYDIGPQEPSPTSEQYPHCKLIYRHQLYAVFMMHQSTVAIHQPNYLPWLGFFHKLVHSDVFVVLDDVQIQKTRSSWVNRTQILAAGKPRWLTIPINRPSGVQKIQLTTILEDGLWRKSHRGRLHEAYRCAPYYQGLSDFLDGLYEDRTNSLLEFNLSAMRAVLDVLELSDGRKLVMASSFAVDLQGTTRLIELVKRVGGDSYLCGSGSSGYLEPRVFEKESMKLVWQNFSEVRRSQLGTATFVPGLSIIDALLTLGPIQTRGLLESSTV